MKKTLYLLSVLLLTFSLPLFTSWLLDWPFIAAHWTRSALVVLLMGVELAVGVLLLHRMTAELRRGT